MRRKAIFKEIALGGRKAEQNNFMVISKEKQKAHMRISLIPPWLVLAPAKKGTGEICPISSFFVCF